MDRETVKKIALLARLEISNDELDKTVAQLGAVVDYIDVLNELDTDGVSPFLHAASATNVFREDEVITPLTPDAALQNAPLRKGNFFRVPRVVDGGTSA